jgi:hypothetical protein
MPPVSVMVTVCAVLDWPVITAGKVNCEGLMLSAGGSKPVPERVTVCVFKISETVSNPV